ncbi:MAG: putative Ig domain-containing protein [Marinilabiliaceae bacterium]|nr:putative Ig domain-containing protein [Marinilabiliaceae bacterium]
MKKNYFFSGLIAILLVTTQSFAQINSGGTPPSFEFETRGLTVNTEINMPINFDVIELRLEDAELENAGHPPRVGKIIPANLTTDNSGEWTTLPNGIDIWRVSIIANEALAIMLTYDKFEIPDGGKLFIYNIDRSRVLGAYTEENNPKRAEYATEFIWGDYIILEYVPPINHEFESPITISGVVYGYNHLYTVTKEGHTRIDFGGSGSCMVNVNCPEGNEWLDQKRGVTRIVTPTGTGYYSLCSGTLINNTAFDLDPLLLSAYHCFANISSLLNQTIYYFHYEHPTCIGRSDPTVPTVTGATMLVNIPVQDGSDGSLLRLNENIPESYNVYYNGWDRRDQSSPSGVGIHHPRGDIQKISTYSYPAESSGGITFVGGDTTDENSNWIIFYDETQNGHSVTEGGSSGSPLFDNNKRVIGTLTGGNSSCDYVDGIHVYGKLWYHWDQYNSTQQMLTYLDPINSGDLFIDGTYLILNDPTITTYLLPKGIVGIEYNHTFHAAGTSPFSWSVLSGNLPDNFTLTSTGVISGIPEAAGTFNFTLQVTNSEGSDTKELSITIIDCLIDTFPYEQGFEENGTLLPDCWTQEFVTNTRAWTIVSNNYYVGPHSGTYMAEFRNNSYYPDVTKLVTPPINLTELPNPGLKFWHAQASWAGDQDELRVYYKTSENASWNLLATYTNNITIWTKETISLPNPSATYYIAFEGTAKYGYGVVLDDIQIISLDAPVITTTSLPSGKVDNVYNQTVTAVGIEPFTWNIETGALPAGLSISGTTGTISGTPTTAGAFYFTVKATNDFGYDTKEFSIEVSPNMAGEGSESDPYIITTPDELAWLATVVNDNNATYNNKYYKLGNDIDLSGYQSGEGWTPIGKYIDYDSSHPFKGVFDGNNHKITGLKINTTTLDFIGLFGYVEGGTIKNLGIEDADIVKGTVSNYSCAGIVAGYINSITLISNCYSTGTVISNSNNVAYAGGIAGCIFFSSISYCYSMGTITAASDYAYTGGIVGYCSYVNSIISNCYSIGTVAANSNNNNNAYSGGIAGYNSVTNALSNCAALNPNINCTGDTPYFGRIVGYNEGTLTSNIAFSLMLNPSNNIIWNNKGDSNLDGDDISKAQINSDETLGGRFTATNGWTTQQGKLPGLFGEVVDMPAHLQFTPGAPEITTESLPIARANIEYNHTLTANGNSPFIWTIVEATNYSLPVGLTLSQSGVISGSATIFGQYNFIIKAENSLGYDMKELSIEVLPDIEGDGSETNPYIITTPDELAWMATVVNEHNTTYSNKHYKLGNNIDLSDYQSGEGWTPIGRYVNNDNYQSFKGVFDGNNHKITGLKINTTSFSCVGLFGYVEGGTIKNLGIENADIFRGNDYNNAHAGIVVGYINSNSIISNCYTAGTITANTSSSYAFSGGVVGYMGSNCIVSNSYSTGTIYANCNYNAYAGGIAGYISSSCTILNCYSIGTISANTNDNAYVGGVIGNQSWGTISNCAALNPGIFCTGYYQNFGRIVGYYYTGGTHTSNIAFADMINPYGGTIWHNIGSSNLDGESFSKEEINADGTLGGRFSAANGWTTQNGKLPGLFGETVDMPPHLTIYDNLIITTTSLPYGEVGIDYNQTLTANGDPPIIWSLEGGNLPPGLNLYGNGTISGIPILTGTYTFTVRATNNIDTDTKTLSINIRNVGIDGNSQPQTLTAWFQNNELHINGLIINEKWSIYNISGVLIYEEIAEKSITNHKLQITTGIYIIRQGNRVVKVVNK